MNIWNIPSWLEKEIKKRDKYCVYCGIRFNKENQSRKSMPTWEHIINNAKIVNRNNIVLCCCSCNASKGAKNLADWLQTRYCIENNITYETVANIVKAALKNPDRCLKD